MKIETTGIGKIGNYYGGLIVAKHQSKFYWIIEDYDTDLQDLKEYEEIPESLYNELIKFNSKNPNLDILITDEIKKSLQRCY
jgi:hypothetical protein